MKLFVTFYYQQKTGFDSYEDPVRDGDVTILAKMGEDYAPGRFRIGASIAIEGINQVVDVNVRNMAAGFPRGHVLHGVHLPLGGAGEPWLWKSRASTATKATTAALANPST